MKGLIFQDISVASLLFHEYDKLIWLDSAAGEIAKEIRNSYAQYKWEIDSRQSNVARQNKVAFYLQSDTLVRSALPIIKHLDQASFKVFVPPVNQENSAKQLDEDGIAYEVFSKSKIRAFKPDVLVCLNDWSKLAKWVIMQARSISIPSVCIQESMIDFSENRRMTFADSVMLQGSFYLQKLDRKLTMLTGNPRYEHLIYSRQSKGDKVLINCNFTYGIFESQREAWLSDITNVLKDQNLEYQISQHPRDKGNLSKFSNVINSSASSVHEQLSGAKLLITRFSSLIHEALFFNIPVIYYNPHGEKQYQNLEIDEKVITLVRNKDELHVAVVNVLGRELQNQDYQQYIAKNCLPSTRKDLPSERIAKLLLSGSFPMKPDSMSQRIKGIYYHPIFRKLSSSVRRK